MKSDIESVIRTEDILFMKPNIWLKYGQKIISITMKLNLICVCIFAFQLASVNLVYISRKNRKASSYKLDEKTNHITPYTKGVPFKSDRVSLSDVTWKKIW